MIVSHIRPGSLDSEVGKMCRIWVKSPRIRGWIPERVKRSTSTLKPPDGAGSHKPFHSKRNGVLYSGGKPSVGEADDLILISLLVTRFKISGTLIPFFHMLLGWNYFTFTSSQLVGEVISFI